LPGLRSPKPLEANPSGTLNGYASPPWC
jgi:hypothetical protein